MALQRVATSLLLATLWLQSVASARPKKDTLYFKNGDKWTCEIKKLDRGYLYVGLEYADGTVSVDWSSISRIESAQLFVVTDAHGVVHTGTLGSAGQENQRFASLVVQSGHANDAIPSNGVASIQQTEPSFWQDFHGGVSTGLNYAKSGNQTQYNLNANLDYIKKYWLASSQLQSSFSGALSEPNNLHNDVSTYGLRMLNKRNYVAIAVSDFLRSDQQQLALRAALGGGFGKILKNTDASRVILVGGAVWTHERYQTEGSPAFNRAEGLAGAVLEYFRFKTTNLSTSVFAYPGLSDPGRIRVDGKAGIKYQLLKNLYLNMSAYLNYDSKPPRPTSKSDYGASSSIGWNF